MIFDCKEKFKLTPNFLERYERKQPKWGPLGYITYKRSYARIVEEEKRTEEFWETIKRVVEGCYTVQLNHCKHFRLPWNAHKAQKSAQKMFQMMWDFKFLPPGRGMWTMGSDIIEIKGSGCLNNCGFVSTKDLRFDFSGPFTWLMDMSMLGVGVAFDCKGAGTVKIVEPKVDNYTFVVEDSKEGWCSIVGLLLDAFVGKTKLPTDIDYSKVRPKGSPIKTFGGIAPGPDPLIKSVEEIDKVLRKRIDEDITVSDIVDIMNIIGKCVVSGGIRRTAELALADGDDEDYIKLKDPTLYPDELKEWRWASNNSVYAHEGMDYTKFVEQCSKNGEPGFVYLENCRKYGRLKDGVTWADENVDGVNPCLTADTLIAVADSRNYVRIDQLEDGALVYCVDDDGNLAIRKMMHPRITGYNKKIYKMTLDDGMVVRATDNHKFRMKNGSYKELKDLKPGDSLDVLTKYHKPDERSESYSDQYVSFTYHAVSYYEHSELAKYKYGINKIEDKHVHHLDENKVNNIIDNIVLKDPESHLFEHSCGEDNPRFSGFSNEKLIEYGVTLCKELKRRFSSDEWMKYALKNGLPSQFSEYRIKSLGKVDEFSKKCAILADVELPDIDTRTLRFYRECIDAGFDAFIEDKMVYVNKICEVCDGKFTIEATRREQCVCSFSCNNKIRDYSKNKEGQRKAFEKRKEDTRNEQVKVFLDVKFSLGREPQKKEWLKACKENGISSEIGRKSSPYTSWKDLKEAACTFNHRIISIESDGCEDVWNGTVEDYHNFFLGGYEGETPKGRLKLCFLNCTQCGEQSLENYELCNLVELFPSKHESYEDFRETLKYAYLYAKTVTLIPTHSERTNQVLLQNRRIGVSLAGIIDAFEKFGRRTFLNWADEGYERITELDIKYSKWLCIPTSIKKTTVKPGGCRPANGLVSTKNGLLTLKEIMKNHPENETWCSTDDNEVYQYNNYNKVLSTFRNGISDIVKIKLSYNLELESTPNHKWFVSKRYSRNPVGYKEVNEWIEAQHLKENDIIELNLYSYRNETPKELKSVDIPSTVTENRGYVVKFPTHMDSDLAWLLGYIWGDGALSEHKFRFRFIDGHIECLEKALKIFEEKFGLSANINKAYEGKNAHIFTIASKHLWEWFKINNFMKYDNVEDRKLNNIPENVRSSSWKHIVSFISGLCDADGCFGLAKDTNKYRIILTTGKEHFAKHIQEVSWSVGLAFGRSHNTKGKNKQSEKSIWLMILSNSSLSESVEIFKNNSIRINVNRKDCNWIAESASKQLIVGKVKSISISEEKEETFDVEIENEPWYWAGCAKSHNTIPLLPGVTPGIHYPHSEYYIRRIRIQNGSPLIDSLKKAGYDYEDTKYNDDTVIFSFPVKTENYRKGKREVSVWEQMENAVAIQHYWSDNCISQTVTLKKEELPYLKDVLECFEDKIKTVSFLPLDDHKYEQAPYEEITKEEFEKMSSKLKQVRLKKNIIIDDKDARELEKFCTNESCQLKL